jgi:HEPN domain-containing protein
MSQRHADWFRQAEADLAHARTSVEARQYEWACFAAQQSAEKSLKALVEHLGGDSWGHSVTMLFGSLADRVHVVPELLDAGKRLDKHYITTRYPNGFDQGAPVDYYTADEAHTAIDDATTILQFVRRSLG